MLTTVRRSRPKGPLRAVPGATNNRKIGGRLCYCDRVQRRALRALPDHKAKVQGLHSETTKVSRQG